MIYGLYNSAAGMMTNEYRQAVLANNLANADTVGFRPDVPTFAERLPATLASRRHGPSAEDLQNFSGGLWLGRTYTDHRPSTTLETGNPLDVALDGPGFLSVMAHGQRLYTRDGRMMMDADGNLVAVTDGASILNRGGAPIHLNPHGGPPSIDTQGRIIQDGAVVAQLELVDFDDYEGLRKVGGARFAAPDKAAFRAPVLVKAGHTERSGVEPVTELVNMLEASRAYEINARMVALQDQSVGQLINILLKP